MAKFLTNEERGELVTLHRKERDRKTGDRIKAVLCADEGMSYPEIAHVLLLDEQTISRQVREYKEKQKLTPSSGGGYGGKLDAKQAEELKQHLSLQTYQTVSAICEYVEAVYKVKYTVPGMTYWLHNQGFSYKKPAAVPSKADPVAQEKFIQKYEELLKRTPENEPILFGDGVHPTMATKITYGCIRRGGRKPIKTTASRTRMNIFGTINLEKMQVIAAEYETIDRDTLVKYFDILKEAYPLPPKIHLIVDQGSFQQNVNPHGVTFCLLANHLFGPNRGYFKSIKGQYQL